MNHHVVFVEVKKQTDKKKFSSTFNSSLQLGKEHTRETKGVNFIIKRPQLYNNRLSLSKTESIMLASAELAVQ